MNPNMHSLPEHPTESILAMDQFKMLALCEKKLPGPLKGPKNEGFEVMGDVKPVIIHMRNVFEKILLDCGGPPIIPTIFKNHPERAAYLRDREKRLHSKRNPARPPKEPFYKFTFADDVFCNIHYNLHQNSYIKHAISALPLSLNKDACGELALEEMLMRKPHFYSSDEETKNLSSYLDPSLHPKPVYELRLDKSKCTTEGKFIVDFTIILPEGKPSTAMVICYTCGRLLETVLSNNVIQILKRDISHNIGHLNFVKEDDGPVRLVLRLPVRGSEEHGCCFAEGSIGVTPLNIKGCHIPSLFVRTRIYYYCNQQALFYKAIHKSKCEQGLYPDHVEHLAKFGIN